LFKQTNFVKFPANYRKIETFTFTQYYRSTSVNINTESAKNIYTNIKAINSNKAVHFNPVSNANTNSTRILTRFT